MCENKLCVDCGRIDVTFAGKVCTVTMGNVNGMTSHFFASRSQLVFSPSWPFRCRIVHLLKRCYLINWYTFLFLSNWQHWKYTTRYVVPKRFNTECQSMSPFYMKLSKMHLKLSKSDIFKTYEYFPQTWKIHIVNVYVWNLTPIAVWTVE